MRCCDGVRPFGPAPHGGLIDCSASFLTRRGPISCWPHSCWLRWCCRSFVLPAITGPRAVSRTSENSPRGDDLNVVFILIDTLRSDRLEAYGYPRATSPNIKALASRGIRFANVEGQSSWTKTSMASLWTGMYPQKTGVLRFSHAVPQEATMARRAVSAGRLPHRGRLAQRLGREQFRVRSRVRSLLSTFEEPSCPQHQATQSFRA